jgi:hypothetical protein
VGINLNSASDHILAVIVNDKDRWRTLRAAGREHSFDLAD